MIGVTLLVSVLYVHKNTESYKQIFLIIIGATGVVAMSPLVSFLHLEPAPNRTMHGFTAIFTASMRFFFVVELWLLRRDRTALRAFDVLSLIVFFTAYAAVDGAALCDHEEAIVSGATDAAAILPLEAVRIWIDGCFAVVILVLCILVPVASDLVNQRRASLLRCCSGLSLAVTAFSDIFCPLSGFSRFSILPWMLLSAVHGSIAAALLTFFRSIADGEYKTLNSTNARMNTDPAP
jgi:heme/copper-type cytochrome/quinol oxidase subunit 4